MCTCSAHLPASGHVIATEEREAAAAEAREHQDTTRRLLDIAQGRGYLVAGNPLGSGGQGSVRRYFVPLLAPFSVALPPEHARDVMPPVLSTTGGLQSTTGAMHGQCQDVA